MANLAVSTMAISPADAKVMYAGTGGGAGASTLRGAGIFKSTDGGDTWSQLASTAASDWSGGVEKISISRDGNKVPGGSLRDACGCLVRYRISGHAAPPDRGRGEMLGQPEVVAAMDAASRG